MRCPDCGTDFPVKPEVIVKTEPCQCGIDESVRFIRAVVFGVCCLILTLGSCTAYQSFLNSKIADKGQSIAPNGMLTAPEKK